MTLKRSIAFFSIATVGVAIVGAVVTAIVQAGAVRPTAELAATLAAFTSVAYMVRHGIGPLALTVEILITCRAFCLGLREEAAAAIRLGVARHPERVARIKQEHAR